MQINVEIKDVAINAMSHQIIKERVNEKIDSLIKDAKFIEMVACELSDNIFNNTIRCDSYEGCSEFRKKLIVEIVKQLPQDTLKDKIIEALILKNGN